MEFNPTAISKTVGKDEYYKNMVKSQSYKFNGAYLLTSCNASESTSDAVYGGLKLAAINGEIEAEENAERPVAAGRSCVSRGEMRGLSARSFIKHPNMPKIHGCCK